MSPEEKSKTPRLLVMGVGGSGARAVARLGRLYSEVDAVAVDTDSRVLAEIDSVRTIHVGTRTTGGFSAGGDVELGRQAIERDSSAIRRQLQQVDLLLLVAGLGRGTASGAAPVITRIAREAGAHILCLLTLPFAFEGDTAKKTAETALKRIRSHADAIVRIANDRLIDPDEAEDIPVEKAFERGMGVILSGVQALWRILARSGVCGLDFADIQTMLRHCDGFCHFAGAEAAGENRAEAVARGILEHRLLDGGRVLDGAAGVIIGLTGGHDLRLSEVETVMNRLRERLPADVRLSFGVTVDPAFDHRLSAIVLVAESWKEPLVDDAVPARGPRQGELPLEIGGRGRFAGTDPTIYRNEDLDVPTYIRRGVKLPR